VLKRRLVEPERAPSLSSPRCWPQSMFGQKIRSSSPRADSVASTEPFPTIADGRCGTRRVPLL
jgi:hypothetical protein